MPRGSGGAWALVAAQLTLAATSAAPAAAATLLVPTDFASIQAAIDAAQPQDVVIVEPGSYVENLSLRANVDVRGREAARTWLAPQDSARPTVNISDVGALRFSNFTMIDAGIAVDVIASSDVQIANVVFDGAANAGVVVDAASAVQVSNNVFFADAVAIRRNAADADVTNNIFSDNDVTVTSPSGTVDDNLNVAANCWSNNADLNAEGIERGYGSSAVIGDPLFVDPAARDFHLQQGSPCIDIGIGEDIIDNTPADAGAYGGPFADLRPYPIGQITLTDTSTAAASATSIDVSWEPNGSYLVTNSDLPGGYRVYYGQNGPGPPYDGTDADGGAALSPIDTGDRTTLALTDLAPAPPAAAAPRLLTADAGDRSVALRWEAADGAVNYRVHYGIGSTDEQAVDAGKVTRYTVTGLVNGTTYRFSVTALTQATYHVAVTAVDSTQNRNESALSADEAMRVGPFNESARSGELTALPQATLPYPPLPNGSGCFVSAAYGRTAEVMVLRDFRDRYLSASAPGRWLVARYYAWSPLLARGLRVHESLKPIARWLLTPEVVLALFWLASSPLTKAVAFGLLLGLGVSICSRHCGARSAIAVWERSA